MFCRVKVSGNDTYLRIIENRRDGKNVRQRVIATRLERLKESGTLDGLVAFAGLALVDSNGEPDGGRHRSNGRA